MPEYDLFHLRITYRTCVLADIVTFIKENAEPLVITHETSKSDVPHIHCVLLGFKQTKSTFFQKFHKLFPSLIGNESHMCQKRKDKEAQLRYCCKGTETEKPNVRYANPQIDTNFYWNEYWKENLLLKAKSNEVNMGLQKDSSLLVKAKTKAKTWTDRTFDEIQEKCKAEILVIRAFNVLYSPSEAERKKKEIAENEIFLLMMRCLGRVAKKFSNHSLFEMFNGFINGILCLQLGDALDPVVQSSAASYQTYLSNKKTGK